MEYYGSGRTPTAEMPQYVGPRTASQVLASVSIDVNAQESDWARRRVQKQCAPYEGPQQLAIRAGDMVFMKRPSDGADASDDGCPDTNPFSVFNGLPVLSETAAVGAATTTTAESIEKVSPAAVKTPEKNTATSTARRYRSKYRFVGVAQDAFSFAEGTLAPTAMQVQIAGIVDWINGSDKPAKPGQFVTWMPDLPELRPIFAASAPPRSAPAVVRARLVPITSKTLTDEDIIEILGAVNTVQSICDAIRTNMATMFDGIIGINQTEVPPGSVGRLVLRG
jgi:hypothetical protein